MLISECKHSAAATWLPSTWLLACAMALAPLGGAQGNDEPTADDPVTSERMREAMLDYFGSGPDPADAPDPELEILEKVEKTDHERWHLRYLVDEAEHAYAYLLIPQPAPTADNPGPLMLCPHPTTPLGKDRVIANYDEPAESEQEIEQREARQYALDLVRRGYIVFAPDRAAFGQRRLLDEGSATEQMSAYSDFLGERYPPTGSWRLTSGKTVWDLQRALDFLVDYEFIDTSRIGAIGHSLGAWDSLMIMAMDDRLSAAVINGGAMLHLRRELWSDPDALRQYLDDSQDQTFHGNANVFLMLTAPRPVLFIWSIQDPYDRDGPNLVDGLREATTYFEQRSDTRTTPARADFSFYLHAHGHTFPPEARALAYQWLDDRLEHEPSP